MNLTECAIVRSEQPPVHCTTTNPLYQKVRLLVHQNYYWPKNVLGQQNHVKGHGICWWRRASQKLMNGTGSPVKLWLAAFKYLAADINNYTKHIQLWDGDLFWKETFGVSIA
jgi:hypothetical protein